MRLLISGSEFPDFQTFKRLVLLADEVAFMDTPSVMFGNFGTVGRPNDIRQFKIDDSPITISVHEAPSGPGERLYGPYVEADLQNQTFIDTVYRGLRDDDFANALISLEGNYGEGRMGRAIVDALIADPSVALPYDHPLDVRPHLAFRFDTPEQRRLTFGIALQTASLKVTSTLLVAEATGLVPVSASRPLATLIGLRTADRRYTGDFRPRASGPLGLAIAAALIPDEVLAEISMDDVFQYRADGADAYRAWTEEIDRLAAGLADMDPETIEREVPRIIAAELRPRIRDYKNELRAHRDRLFVSLMRKVTHFEVPSLSLAYYSHLGFGPALGLFAAALLPTIPELAEYANARRTTNRTNSAAYLVGLMPMDPEDR